MLRRIPAPPFTDISITDPYANEADYMYQKGITAGCNSSPLQFCPSAATQRQQMAVFIVRALLIAQGQPLTGFYYSPTPYFNDVTVASPFFPYVQRLKDLGITGGCSVGPPALFCPGDNVTNGQMAVFTIAAWEQLPGNSLVSWTTTPYYVDVPSTHIFFKFIQKATDLNVFKPVNLCGTNMFCPDNAITRGQSAIDMVRGIIGITSWSITSGTLTDLQTCIGSSGNPNSTTCILSPRPTGYRVCASLLPNCDSSAPLAIGRSGITITGGGGPGDTTLVRGDSALTNNDMMTVSNGVTNVTISNLTFDGNRYGFGVNQNGLSCLGPNFGIYDLNLTYVGEPTTGTFTVQWVDFVNAPGTALLLDGPRSSVSLSNFGQGANRGIGADGTQYPTPQGQLEPADQSATRSTAVYIDGSSNGAWYNAISYAGTAGITLNGSNQYAYGNWLIQNRYEMSDGFGGGVLTLNPGSYAAQVAGNVINGKNWQTGASPSNVNGCSVPANATTGGIEIYGYEHGFWNNELYQNTGGGMVLTGGCTPSCPVGQITISGTNPFDSTDTPKYIEENGGFGILFRAAASGSYSGGTATGATLDNLNVVNNTGPGSYGVGLYGVTNDTTHTNPINGGYYLGFINGSCISGNVLGPVTPSTVSGSSLNYQTPPSGYNTYRGGSCPTPPAGVATPAPSGISGWRW